MQKNRDLSEVDLDLSDFTITNDTPQGTGHQSDSVENEKCLCVKDVHPCETCVTEKDSQVVRSSVKNNKTPKTSEKTMLPSSSKEVDTNNSLIKKRNISSKMKRNGCHNETKDNTEQNSFQNEVSAKKMRIERENTGEQVDTSSRSSVNSNDKIHVPWKAYCTLHKMRKMRKLRIGCVNTQYMHKICSRFSPNAQYMRKICARLYFFPQCAIYAQDLRKIVVISPMRNICARFAQDCTSFPNAQYMHKICARLYFFLQCAIYAQDLPKIVLISPMRNICARFPQVCTYFPNAQYMPKIVLILQCTIYA